MCGSDPLLNVEISAVIFSNLIPRPVLRKLRQIWVFLICKFAPRAFLLTGRLDHALPGQSKFCMLLALPRIYAFLLEAQPVQNATPANLGVLDSQVSNPSVSAYGALGPRSARAKQKKFCMLLALPGSMPSCWRLNLHKMQLEHVYVLGRLDSI